MSIWETVRRKLNPHPKSSEAQPPVLNGVAMAFSLQTFGLSLLELETALRPKQNTFISPLSIFLAMCMIQNGAAGETRAAIRRALRLPADAPEDAVNVSARALVKALQSSGAAEVAIANALWVDVRATIAPDFIRICQETYDATARTLNFARPSSAEVINDWVSEKTNGKIPDIVTWDQIAGSPALLANAIYFKGKFRHPFPKEATRATAFHLADGRTKVVPMMRTGGLHDAYRRGKRFEAAVLHYQGSGIALYMLLPSRWTTPEQILTDACVEEMRFSKESCELDLLMPRFTLDFDEVLNGSLTQLGMGIAFQMQSADFAALGAPNFFIGQVRHKTRLEVDEEGTVAAAATTIAVCMSASSPPRVQRKTLVFDRPFGILLKDTPSGRILFAGVVYEP